ncbi:hypothetical protein Tco_0113531, partial [Tanacetum coccineum]
TVMSDSDESMVTYTEVTLQASPSLDYIPGPEEPQSPPLPDFVLEPVYPEYMSQEDEVFPTKEQSLPATASPTAQSLDYVRNLILRRIRPEEDDDEDPEEDLVDYPADGGDDGDDEDESSEDDEDDDMDIETDDDDEEEHPAP